MPHLRGKGSGRCVRGLLAVGGGSLRLLRDWLLCTCLSTLLFRSSSVVMIFHCHNKHKEHTSNFTWGHLYKIGCFNCFGGTLLMFWQPPTHPSPTSFSYNYTLPRQKVLSISVCPAAAAAGYKIHLTSFSLVSSDLGSKYAKPCRATRASQ